MSDYRIAVFLSTRSVMKAERAFVLAGIPIRTVPVPRHISSECGIAIRFLASYEKQAWEIATAESISMNGVHDEKPG